jgi:hypothetical protein
MMMVVDVERLQDLLSSRLTLFTIDNLFTGMAWGHIMLPESLFPFYRLLFALTLGGSVLWWVRKSSQRPPDLRAALLVIAAAGILVWMFTVTRSLPRISDGFVIPVARYTYPGIVATILMLVGGWWALWPGHLRRNGLRVLVAIVGITNIANIGIVWWYYYGG